MRTALIPQIESTKALGLVFLPGAMTGLVLAGVDASDAVSIQLAPGAVTAATSTCPSPAAGPAASVAKRSAAVAQLVPMHDTI